MRTNDFWQEARRLHFVLPRAPFLDRPASVLPVDFLFGFLMNSIFRQVLGGVKRNDFCAKLIAEALQGHEDDNLVADRLSSAAGVLSSRQADTEAPVYRRRAKDVNPRGRFSGVQRL